MTVQNYFEVQNNVVTNTIVWDGNTQSWTPPAGTTVLAAATTPAMIWEFDKNQNDFVLSQQVGQGQIGFTWNGSVLTTNQPKPTVPNK